MVIDFHTHIVPLKVKENRQHYVQADQNFAAIYADPEARLATAEELIDRMDKDGVDRSVVLNYGWSTPSLCVEINDYILESVARYPKRLIGFCNIVPLRGVKALRELERCIEGGAKGIGELRLDTQFSYGDWLKAIEPLVDLVVRNNLIVLTHSSETWGHQYAGKGGVTPDMLYALAITFPQLKLVCAHWGGGLPLFALLPGVKTALKNVYFDTAASPFLYNPEVYMQVAKLIGWEKILFGSDYPLIPPRRYFKEIEGLKLHEGIKEKILSGNAEKLLGMVGK